MTAMPGHAPPDDDTPRLAQTANPGHAVTRRTSTARPDAATPSQNTPCVDRLAPPNQSLTCPEASRLNRHARPQLARPQLTIPRPPLRNLPQRTETRLDRPTTPVHAYPRHDRVTFHVQSRLHHAASSTPRADRALAIFLMAFTSTPTTAAVPSQRRSQRSRSSAACRASSCVELRSRTSTEM